VRFLIQAGNSKIKRGNKKKNSGKLMVFGFDLILE
jgi:hypothetical protein